MYYMFRIHVSFDGYPFHCDSCIFQSISDGLKWTAFRKKLLESIYRQQVSSEFQCDLCFFRDHYSIKKVWSECDLNRPRYSKFKRFSGYGFSESL